MSDLTAFFADPILWPTLWGALIADRSGVYILSAAMIFPAFMEILSGTACLCKVRIK